MQLRTVRRAAGAAVPRHPSFSLFVQRIARYSALMPRKHTHMLIRLTARRASAPRRAVSARAPLAVRADAAVKPPQARPASQQPAQCWMWPVHPHLCVCSSQFVVVTGAWHAQGSASPAEPPFWRWLHLQGVTLPPVKPAVPPSNFGFVYNAERLNSRAAMVRTCLLLMLLHCYAVLCCFHLETATCPCRVAHQSLAESAEACCAAICRISFSAWLPPA